MSQPSADANLLFGMLALQMDFITREQLIAGMQAWVNEKSTPLPAHLIRLGALQADDRAALDPLIAAHLRRHGNDPEKSLASISSAGALKDDLHCIADADVQHSIQHLRSKRSPSESEVTLTLGTSSSGGTRFHILRPHARGGLGEVFVARDTELGREVALKEIQLDKDDVDSRARFTREAEITGGLEHPGIVPVYGLGAYPDGRPFYAMRFIRGQSLQDAIRSFHAHTEPDAPARSALGMKPPPEPVQHASPSLTRRAQSHRSATEKNLELRRLLQRFIDVCEAIHYAHSRGVLHRDLKPGNIMLGRYGETLVVDWGLAKPLAESSASSAVSPSLASTIDFHPAGLPESRLVPSSHDTSDPTMLGSALGTPAYMSPEQAQGRIDLLGPVSDVFSLGATLYHLLTGQPPYRGANVAEVHALAQRGEYLPPRSLRNDIPRPLEAICLKAMALPTAARYATAKELADDIEHYLGDEPVQALPESMSARLSRWSRRHRHWVQAGGVALLLVALTAVGAYFYQRETAARNLKLADEKDKLANEKGELAEVMTKLASDKSRLADDNLRLADEAKAKAASLRATVAQNYFAYGISEYAAGRENSGLIDLQRAWELTENGNPLKPHLRQVLLDRGAHGGRSRPLPLRHENVVGAVAYSPQGDRVVTGSDDKTARIWDARTGAPLGKPMRHGAEIRVVAFSPQGDRLLTGSWDKMARLWDAKTGAPLGEPMRHEGAVVTGIFNPIGVTCLPEV